MEERPACHAHDRGPDVSDPAGTEYAILSDDEGRSALHASEGLLSMAAHLGVSLAQLGRMSDEERAAAIGRRNLELRALTGAEALRQIAER